MSPNVRSTLAIVAALLWFAALLLICPFIHPQMLPEAPRPGAPAQRSNRALRLASAFDGAVRTLDAVSTERAKPDNNDDLFLPRCIVRHGETMLAFESGVVGAETAASRWLEKRHHHRLALAVPLIDAAATAPWVAHNFVLGARYHTAAGRGW